MTPVQNFLQTDLEMKILALSLIFTPRNTKNVDKSNNNVVGLEKYSCPK